MGQRFVHQSVKTIIIFIIIITFPNILLYWEKLIFDSMFFLFFFLNKN